MKKYILLFRFLILSTLLLAQPEVEPLGVKLTPGVMPPAIVATKFSSEHPNINPEWGGDNDYYSARYMDTNTNMGCIVKYDHNGNFLSVENELHNDAYPVSIAKFYIKKYPGEKYTVWSYQGASGNNKMYYVNREQETVWFNTAGKYMHTVKKEEPSKKEKRPATKKLSNNDQSTGALYQVIDLGWLSGLL